MDRFETHYQRRFVAVNGQLVFEAPAGNVTVKGLTSSQAELWNVTDGWTAVRLSGATVQPDATGYAVSFVAPSAGRYVVASQGAELPAIRLRANYGSDLKRIDRTVDHLIIAGDGLWDSAATFAAYRTSHGLSSLAVSLEEVYDVFNYGIADARAIKAMVSYAYRQWARGPRYILLAGEGSLDFLNYKGFADSVVPSLVASSSSGLYASDYGLADVDGNGTPDVAVGRLPIRLASQFASYLTKVQGYEAGGAWKQRVGVATDDRDQGGVYVAEGNTLASSMGNYSVLRADVETLGAAGARSSLLNCLSAGSELTLYLGHGSLSQVAAEGLLTVNDAASLTNNVDRAPVLALFGCLMGDFGAPGTVSLGESLVTSTGGASAVLAAGTLVAHADSRGLAGGLVAAIYQDGTARLGDAVVAGQTSGALGTYELLGDPALAVGSVDAPRGGPAAHPARASYAEWVAWAYPPAWIDLGFYFGPDFDGDSDGATAYQEYYAGTDPLDASSRLFISRVRVNSSRQVELTWPSVPGRTYGVEKASAVNGRFVPVAAGLPATAPWNTWTDTAPSTATRAWYRIVVE